MHWTRPGIDSFTLAMLAEFFNLLVNELPRSFVQRVAEDSIELTADAYFHSRFASARRGQPAESVRERIGFG